MTRDNLTAVLHGINDLRLEQTPIEEPGPNEVLLEIASVGICGSDVHYLVEGKIGDFVVRDPMIIGHESSGRVSKVGPGVNNVKVGDRVAIEPGVPCRVCEFCKLGRYNLCKEIVFCATPPHHGSLRRFFRHAADFCFKIPDSMSYEEAALLEPLSVGVHACKRAQIGIGSRVLVMGAGPVGLCALLVAKAMGAQAIMSSDIVASRLEMAKGLGADLVYQMGGEKDRAKIVQQIVGAFEGNPPDITIDATGSDELIHLSALITKAGGSIVLVGMGQKDIRLPIDVIIKELDVKGVFRYVNDYQDALNLVAQKKVNVKPMISHRFSLEQTLDAFECAKSRTSGAVKVIINCMQ